MDGTTQCRRGYLAAGLIMLSCGVAMADEDHSPEANENSPSTGGGKGVEASPFGELPDGREVTLYRLNNDNALLSRS